MENKKSFWDNWAAKITVIGGVFGAITWLRDYTTDKPITTTLFEILNWIWNNILNMNVTIWQVLIALVILYIILRIIYRTPAKEKYVKSVQDYITDEIDGITWRWYWKKYLGNYHIEELRPVCEKCDTSMIFYDNLNYSRAECPKCDNRYNKLKALNKVDAIIVDNARQNRF